FDLAGDNLPNAAELHLLPRGLGTDHSTLGQVSPLGNDDQRELLALALAMQDIVANVLEAPRNFGNQDDVATTRDARVQGDPAGVASHHFEHHDPLVARSGGVQAIEGV